VYERPAICINIFSLLVASGSAFSNVLKAKEDLQKSPEQLEQEKRSIIAQRVPPLQLDGKTKEDLIEKVFIKFLITYIK
jgi:tRNA(Ser,Leu) C12 N-acetylase TAN1